LTFGFLCLWLQDWPSLSSSGEERRVEERRAEERGERERERNMLFLFNRAGRESHWFDIKMSKNHGFGLSCALDAPKCCVTNRHAPVLTVLVFDGLLFYFMFFFYRLIWMSHRP
jgi:hypothetical protein